MRKWYWLSNWMINKQVDEWMVLEYSFTSCRRTVRKVYKKEIRQTWAKVKINAFEVSNTAKNKHTNTPGHHQLTRTGAAQSARDSTATTATTPGTKRQRRPRRSAISVWWQRVGRGEHGCWQVARRPPGVQKGRSSFIGNWLGLFNTAELPDNAAQR